MIKKKQFFLYQLIYLILGGMDLLSSTRSGQAQNWFLWTEQHTENSRKTLWHFPAIWVVAQTLLPFPSKTWTSQMGLQVSDGIKTLALLLSSCCSETTLSQWELLLYFQVNTEWRVCISIPKPRVFHSLWKFVYTLISTSGHRAFTCIHMSKVSILNICVSLRDKIKNENGIKIAFIVQDRLFIDLNSIQ